MEKCEDILVVTCELIQVSHYCFSPLSLHLSSLLVKVVEMVPYLTVQSKQDDHDEEEDGPEWSHGHLSNSLGVDNERKPWTWDKGAMFD